MVKISREAARKALAATDWEKLDALTDEDIARQIAANPDAAPEMAPEVDVRAIRRAAGMSQAQFATAYEFSVRTVQEWERGAKRPSGPARTLLKAIKADPEGRGARSRPKSDERDLVDIARQLGARHPCERQIVRPNVKPFFCRA